MMIVSVLGVYLSLWALTAHAVAIAPLPSGCDCAGTAFNSSLAKEVFCGDPRLGPIDYQSHDSKAIVPITRTWHRLGRLCPGEFLKRWTNKDGRFIYPIEDGFQLDSHKHAIKQTAVLCPGTLVDRFGGEQGSFLAPAGMRYEARSIPPSNLVTVTRKEPNSSPFNYHVYMVLKPMQATAGCIAPWFEQPGLGVQYLINGSVTAAIQEGFLRKFDGQKSALLARERRQACGTCKPTSLSCPGYQENYELLAGGIRPIGLQA
ncbi:uncharacterized protein CPUR_01295 [Claviceps purpurea 20.1]|uniref:TNT domain-containing protein n=1 Tax=Claviceps purpurea (strain 20.1) TaxID=1111077 RepID=M1VZ50_CLAP2|nr:uncharacterized protein CPUR_01295 [Claviceps purpurea 20.1]